MFEFMYPDEEFSLGNVCIGGGASINYAMNWLTGSSMMFLEGPNLTVIAFHQTQAFENKFLTN